MLRFLINSFIIFIALFLYPSCSCKNRTIKERDRIFIDIIQDSLDCFIMRVGPIFRDGIPENAYSIHTFLNETNDTIVSFQSDIATANATKNNYCSELIISNNDTILLSSFGLSFNYLLNNPLDSSLVHIFNPYDENRLQHRDYSMITYRYSKNPEKLIPLHRRIGRNERVFPLYSSWLQLSGQNKLSEKQIQLFLNEYKSFIEKDNTFGNHEHLELLAQNIVAKNRIPASRIIVRSKDTDTDFILRMGNIICFDDVERYLSFLSSHIIRGPAVEIEMSKILRYYPKDFLIAYTELSTTKKQRINNYLSSFSNNERESIMTTLSKTDLINKKDKKRLFFLLSDLSYHE